MAIGADPRQQDPADAFNVVRDPTNVEGCPTCGGSIVRAEWPRAPYPETVREGDWRAEMTCEHGHSALFACTAEPIPPAERRFGWDLEGWRWRPAAADG